MVNSKSKVFYKGKRIFVGIDVHKKRWVVTVRTYDLELKTFSMQPSAEELERFLLDNYDGALIHIVYECCFSGFWIYDYFHQRGYKIIVTPVNRVYWDGSIVKTDKIDSRKFAFQHSRDLLRKVKNGSVIRGIIVESIPNKSVKIQTKDGNIFFYNIDEIEKITKEVSDDSFSDKNDSKIVSQTQSGSLFIGGEIYYSSVSTKYNYSLNRFMFAPKIGFFVVDNLLLGVSLAYANVSNNSSSQDQFIIGPILRYYFGSSSSKPFTYLVFAYNTQVNYNSTTLGLGFGYNFAISRNVALSPVMQYDFVAPKSGDLGDIKEFYVGIGISAFIF